MLKCKKGDIACIIDYPRSGNIEEVVVASSGRKYVMVVRYPYLKFDADTLYNISAGGKLFIGSKQQYLSAKKHAQEKAVVLDKVKNMLHELSMIQLRDIEHQINQMLS